MAQSIPLIIKCPYKSGTCSCKGGNRQWYFVSCKHECHLNDEGSVFCKNGCSNHFIQNIRFICSTCKTEEQEKSLANFFSNLTSALESASYDLSENDKDEFIMNLFASIKKRWVK